MEALERQVRYDRDVSDETRDAEAAKRNVVIVHPAPDELFVDMDDGDSNTLNKGIMILNQHGFEASIARWTPSPSGKPGHYHVVVKLCEAVDDVMRCLLQACLGSDRQRELFNLVRIRAGMANPVCLFEKPEMLAPKKVIEVDVEGLPVF